LPIFVWIRKDEQKSRLQIQFCPVISKILKVQEKGLLKVNITIKRKQQSIKKKKYNIRTHLAKKGKKWG
jgi:hypothetical protein